MRRNEVRGLELMARLGSPGFWGLAISLQQYRTSRLNSWCVSGLVRSCPCVKVLVRGLILTPCVEFLIVNKPGSYTGWIEGWFLRLDM